MMENRMLKVLGNLNLSTQPLCMQKPFITEGYLQSVSEYKQEERYFVYEINSTKKEMQENVNMFLLT